MGFEVIRFVGVGTVFTGLLIGTQALYTYQVNPIPLEELVDKRHAPVIQGLEKDLRDGQRPILMFGDSVNFCYAPKEDDKRKISEMLGSLLPGERVVTVDGRAYHLGVYEGYLRYALRHGRVKPTLLVVPVNLRSFTAHWILNPGWRFDDLQRYLRHAGIPYDLAYRPLKSFKVGGDPDMTEAQYQESSIFDGWTVVGKVKDFNGPAFDQPTDRLKRAKVTFYYMQGVDRYNARLKQLRELARTARRYDQRVLFYIGPLDYQVCDPLLDNRFSPQMRQNAAVIKAELEKEGYPVLDLSLGLDSDGFYYRSPYPDEHLNQKGRGFVAAKLRDWIVAEFDPAHPGR